MADREVFDAVPIGFVVSPLTDLASAPRQADEGAPDATLRLDEAVAPGLLGLEAGHEIEVLTWLHRGARDTLMVHPRSDASAPLRGVFATRSPDRPNPIGLHRVTVRRISGSSIHVGGLEALDGTPVLDIKPVLGPPDER
jgi:tRNA-Thr(GGU) m(6)t(6)A37 methyltransferase TsaA